MQKVFQTMLEAKLSSRKADKDLKSQNKSQ